MTNIGDLKLQGATQAQYQKAEELLDAMESLDGSEKSLTEVLEGLKKTLEDPDFDPRSGPGSHRESMGQNITRIAGQINDIRAKRGEAQQELSNLQADVAKSLEAGPSVIGQTVAELAKLDPMDLESLMILVQTKRANIMEKQIRSQLEVVKGRNSAIENFTALKNALNAAAGKASSSNPNDVKDIPKTEMDAINQAAKDAGIKSPDPYLKVESNGTGKYSYADLSAKATEMGGRADSFSNSQQLEMLDLQKLNNRYNEAIDMMSNFVKKCADKREGIIRNW